MVYHDTAPYNYSETNLVYHPITTAYRQRCTTSYPIRFAAHESEISQYNNLLSTGIGVYGIGFEIGNGVTAIGLHCTDHSCLYIFECTSILMLL